MNPPAPTVIDLFCGAGGLSEGFKQAGFEILLGVDNDHWSVETYRRRHGKALEARIEDLTSRVIAKETNGRHVTVLAGGPPCQAFSTVAVAKLRSLGQSTTRRHPLNRLYREFLRLVKELAPPFFVMENVGRMFSIANGAIRTQIETELGGKYLISFYYENVVHYGVPQFRKRGLVIGNRIGVPNPTLEPTHYAPSERGIMKGLRKYETIRNAIADLPRLKAGEGAEEMGYTNFANISEYAKQRRIGSFAVYNHVARKHSNRDLEIFRTLNPGQWIADLPKKLNPYRKDIFLDKYKKQKFSRPSSTILAHLSKDGLMFIHPDKRQNRSFTAREAARLQSFDDTYKFEGPRTRQFTQIGNAVPPLFSRIIAESILKAMILERESVQSRGFSQNHTGC
jgi:DNA (cytosine-5)-methyltransferase 1